MSERKPANPLDIVRGIVFFLVGLELVIGTLSSAQGSLAFGRRALVAEGRVIRLNAGGSHPEIRFTTRGGQTIEYPQGGMISGYEAGQRVQVLYDPADPHDVVLDTFGARWGPAVGEPTPPVCQLSWRTMREAGHRIVCLHSLSYAPRRIFVQPSLLRCDPEGVPGSKIEHTVLLVLLSHQFVSAATICRRLPHLNPRSVANALAFLTADRSVRRVRHGVYELTALGRARATSSPGS